MHGASLRRKGDQRRSSCHLVTLIGLLPGVPPHSNLSVPVWRDFAEMKSPVGDFKFITRKNTLYGLNLTTGRLRHLPPHPMRETWTPGSAILLPSP